MAACFADDWLTQPMVGANAHHFHFRRLHWTEIKPLTTTQHNVSTKFIRLAKPQSITSVTKRQLNFLGVELIGPSQSSYVLLEYALLQLLLSGFGG
jgi:hypothetical protein